MATAARRPVPALMETLRKDPGRFTFVQAIRILLRSHAVIYDERMRLLNGDIRIRPWLSLAFPSNGIDDLTRDADGSYELTVTNFGLYGTLGALPTFYTDELMEEARRDENVIRGFLDIVNNHLYRLLYRAESHYLLERRIVEDNDPQAVDLLHCLTGEPFPSLRHGAHPLGVMVEYLSNRRRTAVGLVRYLSILLGRDDIEIEQCVERRVPVPSDQRCMLGTANATLGGDAVLGREIKDGTGCFHLHFMRASEEDVKDFLPRGKRYGILAEYVGRFLNRPLEYGLILHPLPVMPQRRLGMDAALGMFLGGRPAGSIRVARIRNDKEGRHASAGW